jgi:hypothetical protein
MAKAGKKVLEANRETLKDWRFPEVSVNDIGLVTTQQMPPQ